MTQRKVIAARARRGASAPSLDAPYAAESERKWMLAWVPAFAGMTCVGRAAFANAALSLSKGGERHRRGVVVRPGSPRGRPLRRFPLYDDVGRVAGRMWLGRCWGLAAACWEHVGRDGVGAALTLIGVILVPWRVWHSSPCLGSRGGCRTWVSASAYEPGVAEFSDNRLAGHTDRLERQSGFRSAAVGRLSALLSARSRGAQTPHAPLTQTLERKTLRGKRCFS